MTDTKALGEVTVLALDGKSHTLASVFEGQPTVLVWLRHYG